MEAQGSDGPTPSPAADRPTRSGDGRAPASAPGPGPAGERTFGRYRLLGSLGVGGMGVVWRAHDATLGREVALKELHAELAGHAALKARFHREATLAARLRHPGIVPVHDVGEIDGRPYYTMDLVAGKTFADRLLETMDDKRAGRPEGMRRLSEEVGLLAQVAAAVGYAHSHGVLHRDLKPGNVLVAPGEGAAWTARVADFGLAKETGLAPSARGGPASAALTVAGELLGTPAYLSPEQADGDLGAIGPGTDVWALGVMLYEVLTGRLPFPAADPAVVVAQIRGEDPLPPARHRPDAPAPLAAVCLKALEKPRSRRYADAGEFAAELERWLTGEPVRARPPSRGARLGRWLARRRGAAAAALAVVLAVAAPVAWSAWGAARAREQAAAQLREVAARIERFLHESNSVELSPEAGLRLVEQPLGVLDRLLRDDPGNGAALAWRGRVRSLTGDRVAAFEDLDRACALTPDRATVWWLRGRVRLELWLESRPLGASRSGTAGVERLHEPESEAARGLLQAALEDLARMRACPRGDPAITSAAEAIVNAQVLAYDDPVRKGEEALRAIEGRAEPEAERVRAHVHREVGRLDEAIAALDRLCAAWPFDLSSALQRATFLRERAEGRARHGEDGRPDLLRAIAELDAAVARRSDRVMLFLQRGFAHLRLGDERGPRGEDPVPDYRDAVADFDRALALEPRLGDCVLNRGAAWAGLARSRLAHGEEAEAELARAEADFTATMERWPDFPDGYVNLAIVLTERMQWTASRGEDRRAYRDRALAALERAIALAPGDPDAWQTRGSLWRAWAEVPGLAPEDVAEASKRALADLDEALQRKADFAVAWEERAFAWGILARSIRANGGDPREAYDRAIAEAGRAAALAPNRVAGHVVAGTVWAERAEFEEAAGRDPRPAHRAAWAALTRALELRPGHGGALVTRAATGLTMALMEEADGVDGRARFDQAEADARAAVGAGVPWAYRHLGHILRARGRTAEALAALQAFARAFPDPGEADLNDLASAAPSTFDPWVRAVVRANRLLESGDRAGSLAQYERALEGLRARLAELDERTRGAWFATPAWVSMLAGLWRNAAAADAQRAVGKLPPGATPPDEAARRVHEARALDRLEEAFRLGYADRDEVRQAEEFQALREHARFRELVAGGK